MRSFTGRRREQLAGELGAHLFPPAYRSPAPSPDGSLLAWISDRDGRPRAFVAPAPTPGEPLAQPADPLDTEIDPDVPCDVVALAWSPDGTQLACQVAPGGGERTRVLLLAPDGSERRELAAGSAAVTLGSWSPSGRQLGITVYSAEGDGTGVASLLDVRDGSSIMLGTGAAPVVCAVSRDGRLVVVRAGRRGHRGLELIDLETGRRIELLPGSDATVADARFGITGSVLYLHTDAGGERPALLACTVTDEDVSLAWDVARREDADLELVALDPTGARAGLVWNVGGWSELELMDLRDGLPVPLPAPPADVVTGLAFGRDGEALLVAGEGATVPPHVVRIALEGPAGPTPLLPESVRPLPELVAPTLHAFPAEDGLELTGWLFRGHGIRGAVPTLIWLHGGPEAQERPVFQPLFQALVAAGVQVFAPNVRGSAGYGRAFTRADDRERRFTAIPDVRAAVTFLTSTGLGEPGRIGVAGRSYGGYLTLVALAWFPELFAVGVDVCGMSDLQTFYADTEPWIAASATTKYGDPHADRELLASLSPIHRVDAITAPLLVVHGRYDTNVPLGEAQRIVRALEERGAAPRLLLFDDEGHEIHALGHRIEFVAEVVAWVAGHLTEAETRSA